jgi:hypothetical protein
MKWIAILSFLSQMAIAVERDQKATYVVKDGYGEYVGQGTTKWKAAEEAWEKCVNTKADAYEKRHGNPPDLDTLDLFIDACINL